MFAAGPGNYALRVYLDSVNSNMCQYAFIYINADDGNYQVYSSLLMSSWVAGKTIEATITKDSQGFCHIVEFYAR
ncbi:hypothetical protein [Nitrospirillum iridis]|uniref:Uncharacterized protein n=1 Tax=Nitrospirillum iridis TaxID=765888 RepID=A0A7X0EEW1_9PROT|nr:hypothetical protein [Nitrospirillum iridis]MBB6252451.1 hypothetical protein [Nitrospirillum iridis]